MPICCISFISSLSVILGYNYLTPTKYTNLTSGHVSDGLVSSDGAVKDIDGPAHVLISSSGSYDACTDPSTYPPKTPPWIAIITRGGINCTFSIKIQRAKNYGAQAVLIFDPTADNKLYDMVNNCSDMVSIFISRQTGGQLLMLATDNQTKLNITIQTTKTDSNPDIFFGSESATIFIAASVCILICLCLSWLIFYYCQRRRTSTAKDRLQRRLEKAAKTALNKISLVSVNEEPQPEQTCVICLDLVKSGDVLRQLVCGHAFHQDCVDPWLLDKRHCPLCNLDILTAYCIPVPRDYHANNTTTTTTTVTNSAANIPYTVTTTATSNRINNVAPSFAPIHQLQDNSNNNYKPIPTISASVNSNGYQSSPRFRNDNHTLSAVSPVQPFINTQAFDESYRPYDATNPTFISDDERL
ncbi:unnamed protein product [Didymodactylos carnosus]|uniref:RING-type domain-containing protein n=1 Tax=Didymodactylos carnosus TaxID=1234261 RepID=A0A813YUT9_9BILA|nr:unnamed protein product [Didymodactylos carnosus]CAF1199014.1 unnamed protein product [Didymodactylos carnosus]CAF3673991.1 unnamed protein product [Didymodactylos carnosus]CAF4009139.1 unnamed protein product [Didymodactylos carnosus]